MAIARDAYTNSGDSSGTDHTFSHTCGSGATRLFVAFSNGFTNTDDVSGVTYNGVAMSFVAKQVGGFAWNWYLYTLASPAAGAHNVVVSFSASKSNVCKAAWSYTGSGTLGTPSTVHETDGDVAASVTVGAATSWLVGFGAGSAGTMTPGTGTTSVGAFSGTFTGYAAGLDSNGTVSTGSQSMAHASGSANFIVVAELEAAAGGSTMTPAAGSVALTGNAPTRFQQAVAATVLGALTLTGLAPAVVENVNRAPAPPAGAITIEATTPAVNSGTTLAPAAGSVTFTGSAVTVQFQGPDVGSIAFTGLAPTLSIIQLSVAIPVPAGTITFSGTASVIGGGGGFAGWQSVTIG